MPHNSSGDVFVCPWARLQAATTAALIFSWAVALQICSNTHRYIPSTLFYEESAKYQVIVLLGENISQPIC